MSELARAPFAPGGESAIDSAIAERLLSAALESGGDYADLFFEYRISASYVLEEEKIKTVGRGVTMGLGVRVTKGDATGYAYSEAFDLDRMEHAARTAGQIASGGGAPAPIAIESIAQSNLYDVGRPTISLPAVDKLSILRKADAAARAHDPRIVKVEASFAEELREILVITSDGRMTKDQLPLMRIGVRAVAQDGTKLQSGSSGGGGRQGMDYFDGERHDPVWHGNEAARVAIAMLDAREAPAGQLPVVLAAGDSGILLHEAVGHGLEADFNRKKTSNYSGQVGNNVASELCTVVDSGVIEGSRGSINVDDEGHGSRENVLIDSGTLVGYMHDRLSARHFGVEPTGNGRRQSFRCMPMPRMTNTSLLPGESDPEEIIKSVERGVFAKRFSGGQVNISNGDFVFSLTESYLIEDGKLTAPLKGVNLIGNGPECLRTVSMVGSDFQLSDGMWTCGKDGQSVPVGVGTPTIKVGAITVGGTQTS